MNFEAIVSNVRYEWHELRFPIFRRTFNRPKNVRPNSAIDTETYHGKAFLITDDRANYLYPKHWVEIDDWLFDKERWRYTNYCYNLDYDVRAFLAFVPAGNIEELWLIGQTTINSTLLEYIPSKYFCLRRNRHRVELFDLAQFYRQSLDQAAKRYLNEGKLEIDTDRIDSDWQYVLDNWDRIREYCIRDSELTKRLADFNVKHFGSVGIRSNKWYSPAYISEQYFLANAQIPRMHFKDPQTYGYYSYAGGRFEVFERGYFDEVYKYDIHSAYPFVMKDLPDLDTGEWRMLDKYDPQADLAFLKVKIRTRPNYVQPLHYKLSGLVVYPEAERHLRIITKSEYEVIRDFDLADIEIIDGWHFYNRYGRKPFAILADLYKWRSELKGEEDPREYVLKILMNSIYGKTIQINPLRLDEEKHRVGNLFIPVYASEITAQTRMRLLRECLEREIRPLAFFTDAIVLRDKESFAEAGLGTWGLEEKGEAVLLGSGVYSIRSGDKMLTRLRGFRNRKDFDLFSLLEKNRDKSYIPLVNRRPVSMGEFVRRFLESTEVTLNMWLDRQKFLSINFDSKRIWDRDFDNCADALSSQIESVPLTVH